MSQTPETQLRPTDHSETQERPQGERFYNKLGQRLYTAFELRNSQRENLALQFMSELLRVNPRDLSALPQFSGDLAGYAFHLADQFMAQKRGEASNA